MESAPRNGETVMCRSREWNNPNAALQVQPGQWLCDMKGQDWRWRLPDRQGTTIYADGWMTFAEFRAAQKAEGFDENAPFVTAPTKKPEFNSPSNRAPVPAAPPAVEFDL